MVHSNITESLLTFFGEPKRYAYKACPVTLSVSQENHMKPVKYYSVDFEIACDMFSIEDARSENCIYNSHLVNIVEPGLDLDVDKPYISHNILLDEEHYNRLLSVTNSDGNLRRYDGVVEGYSIADIKSKLHNNDLIDTGLCLSEEMLRMNGLRRPEKPFNEKRHARFIQASESHMLKARKKSTALSTRIYEPTIRLLSYDNIYEFV